MKKIKREDKIKNQALMCNMLMQKLYDDCTYYSVNCPDVGYIPKYTKMQNDITKLRNELSDLSKLLDNT